MFGVIGFLIGKEFYVSALCLMGVYAFRFFHIKGQRIFHYGFALTAFLALGYFSGIWWPLVLGSAAFMLNKVLHTNKEVFWFEMFAGIPYLFLI